MFKTPGTGRGNSGDESAVAQMRAEVYEETSVPLDMAVEYAVYQGGCQAI